MVALAPEHPTEAGSDRWLGPFLAAWQPGTGEPHEVREPATGRPLLMLNRSTPDDVRRATRAAKAAEAAWAGTSDLDRAGILRWRWATPSCSSRIRRRLSAAGPCSPPSSRRRACLTASCRS